MSKEFIANLERSEVVRVGKSGPRASPLALKKLYKQEMRVTSSFHFFRRGTQLYDELLAAVPIRTRPCMMLEMINTSHILSISENARARNSSVAGHYLRDFLQGAVEVSSLRSINRISLSVRKKALVLCCRDGAPHCEGCGIEINARIGVIHEHVISGGLGN